MHAGSFKTAKLLIFNIIFLSISKTVVLINFGSTKNASSPVPARITTYCGVFKLSLNFIAVCNTAWLYCLSLNFLLASYGYFVKAK